MEKAESRWRTVAAPCACRQVASMRGSSGRSRRATRDRQLRVATRGSHEASHRCYEHPRVWKDFREAGEHVSEQRVARLMRAEGLRAFHTPRVGDGLKRRGPDAGLLHHSDQGCTYASDDYRTRLEQAGITCSMSRRRNCFDNAVMETGSPRSRAKRASALKATHTPKRPCSTTSRCSITSGVAHSTLEQISPAEFDR